MSCTVRPVHESERDAAAQVWTCAVPHEPFSAEDFRKRDAEQHGWASCATRPA